MLQFVVGGAIIGTRFLGIDWPGSLKSRLRLPGLAIAAGGATLFGLGIAGLGKSLTPLPRPHDRAELRRGGIYRLVRHPVYGGIAVAAFGLSLAESPAGLVPTGLLGLVFDLKSRREEAWLVERYPEYEAYRAVTVRRFVPWLL